MISMAERSIGNSSSIRYSGNVTMRVMHGKRVAREIESHNTGTVELMGFITKCLGGSMDPAGAPKYLRLFKMGESSGFSPSENDEMTVRAVVSNFYPSYGEDSNNAEASVTLTFLVPYTMLKSSTEDKSFDRIALYSTNNANSRKDCMAWLKVDNTSLVKGESLMVMWKMTLSNKQ